MEFIKKVVADSEGPRGSSCIKKSTTTKTTVKTTIETTTTSTSTPYDDNKSAARLHPLQSKPLDLSLAADATASSLSALSASSFLPLVNQRAQIPTDFEWSPAVVCGLSTPPPSPHPTSTASTAFSSSSSSSTAAHCSHPLPHFPPTSAAEVGAAAATTVTALAAAVADSAHLVVSKVKGEETAGDGGGGTGGKGNVTPKHATTSLSKGIEVSSKADTKANAAASAGTPKLVDVGKSSNQSTPGEDQRLGYVGNGDIPQKPLMFSQSAPDMATASLIRDHLRTGAIPDRVNLSDDPHSQPVAFDLSADEEDDDDDDDDAELDEVSRLLIRVILSTGLFDCFTAVKSLIVAVYLKH